LFILVFILFYIIIRVYGFRHLASGGIFRLKSPSVGELLYNKREESCLGLD